GRVSRCRPGPARRAHRRPRALVVQPAGFQHRAAAAPQPRGCDTGGVRSSRSRGARPGAGLRPADPTGRTATSAQTNKPETPITVALDPQLLDILACPEDKGPLLYFEGEDSLYNPRLKRRYSIKDDIPIMLIDEAETVDDAEHARLVAKAEADGIEPTFSA